MSLNIRFTNSDWDRIERGFALYVNQRMSAEEALSFLKKVREEDVSNG